MCNKYDFNISRESIGLEPFIKKVDPINSNHKIKNNSFKIKECQKFLDLKEDQIKNAIKIGLLKAATISDVLYISIDSALYIKDNQQLIDQIIDEDEITTNTAAEILDINTKNVRRLIDEGYLTIVGKFDFKYGTASLVKRGEVKNLISQINEIKEFWKSQAKINRQLGAKKAVATRKTRINLNPTFKDHFLKEIENLPHKKSRLIRAAVCIVALNYYITRKLTKNIVDEELIELKNNASKKLFELYDDSGYMHTRYIQGFEPYVYYCNKCLEQIKELKYDLSISWAEAKSYFQPCHNCKYDDDYFSAVVTHIHIGKYEFNIYLAYKDINTWFDKNLYPCEIPTTITYFKEDHFFIDREYIPIIDVKTFKIFEVVDYLKEFINSKDLDFSFNI